MLKRLLLLAFTLLFWIQKMNAQYSDSTHYYLNLASTGSINKTNTSSSFLLNNGAKFGIKRKDIALNYSASWVYGTQNHLETNNDFFSSLNFNVYKTIPHFFYWGLGNYNTSYSLKIINQLQGGLGIAYNILDRKNAMLNFSEGVLYETSDLYVMDTSRQKYHTFRNSVRLNFKFNYKDRVTLNGSTFLQNSLNYKDDYNLMSNITLGIKLKKWLSITSAFNYNKIARTNKENLLFTYGLAIEKYF